MAEQEPLLNFCDDYPTFSVSAKITLPFGLPEIQYDTSCEGVHLAIPDINASISAIYPIVRLAGCLVKLVEIVTLVPDSIGPPPDPTKIATMGEKITEFADCLTMFGEFSVVGAVPTFCKFIRDLINFVIAVLTCIKTLLTATIKADEQVTALKASADAQLQGMGNCMEGQLNGLKSELNFKFNGAALFIDLINALTSIMPAPVGGNPPISSAGTLEMSPAGLDALDAIIDVLETARVPFDACA